MNHLINDTRQLAKQVIERCIKQKKTLIAAESMTGGLLISELTAVPDASKVIDRSLIVYSDQAKIDMLGVSRQLIKKETVYSEAVVEAMIQGLNQQFNGDIKVAISGVAGPKAYRDTKVGTVFIGLGIHDKIDTYKLDFKGDRQSIRYQCVHWVCQKILEHLSKEG